MAPEGNNRLDSHRNIIADPRVALFFMIPGINETLRINGPEFDAEHYDAERPSRQKDTLH